MKYKIGSKVKSKSTGFKGVIKEYWETEDSKQYFIVNKKFKQWVTEKDIKIKKK